MTGALLFVAGTPEIAEEDGFFHITITSGNQATTYVMSAHTFMRMSRATHQALDAFHERQQGIVKPLKSTRR